MIILQTITSIARAEKQMRAFFPVPRAKLFGVLKKTRCFNFCLSYTFVFTPISRFLSSVTTYSQRGNIRFVFPRA